eukprot:GHVT01061578.1.p1 GENE.GHVT01061578.1~~GHVT01061578.1.p1  ORF type:complete len:196 (-),score=42.02 GHVT01061578.1:433-1020(-)
MALALEAAALGVALVVGTTGLTDEEATRLSQVAGTVPVMHAMNFSLGVNLLFWLSGEASRALGSSWDIEIVESHHSKKVDAPSGTAIALVDSICTSLGTTRAQTMRCGREGIVGKRPEGSKEIGVHSLRLGNVVGDHTVTFATPFEKIELTHKAQDRAVFADGALKAAKWLAAKKNTPRLYDIKEMLFPDMFLKL